MKNAAKFTRESPCTKLELWNCFRSAKGYLPVPVVNAKAQIGDNAPKYMLREGYIRLSTVAGVDYYLLTTEGARWLEKGIARHVELHPETESQLAFPIPGTASRKTVAVTAGPKVLLRRR